MCANASSHPTEYATDILLNYRHEYLQGSTVEGKGSGLTTELELCTV